jgi:DNA-binding CsgD family transcriptional regulator
MTYLGQPSPAPPSLAFSPELVDELLAIFPGAKLFPDPKAAEPRIPAPRKWPLLGSQYLYQYDFRDQRLTYLSDHFQALTGHDPRQTDLYFLYSIIHPEDLPLVLKATTLMANFAVSHTYLLHPLEHVFSIDFRIRKADGNYLRILRQTIILEKSLSQAILSLVSVCTDISHQKKSHDIHFSFNLPEFDEYLHDQKEEFRFAHLGKREEEILKLLISGKRTKEIARDLNLSILTVETHRKNLKKKLKLHNTAELVLFGLSNGIEPGP